MARNFDGANGNYWRVSNPALDGINGTALTVSIWVKPNDSTTGDMICAKEDGSGAQFDMFLESSVVTGRISDGTFDAVNGSGLSITNWSHVLLRKNGTGANALEIYVNGVVAGQATSNKTIQVSTDDFYIGNRGQDNAAWSGLIAEVAIWNLALSAPEILQLFNGARANTIQLANLKGYWPLCGLLAASEPDHSGNGCNALLTGTSAASSQHPFNNSYCNLAPQSPAIYAGRGAA